MRPRSTRNVRTEESCVSQLCLLNRIAIFLTGTDNMMADGLTKPVDKTKFLKCRDYILTKT